MGYESHPIPRRQATCAKRNHDHDDLWVIGRKTGRLRDDNALAETINGLYKAEVIHRRGPWRSFEAVEYATL